MSILAVPANIALGKCARMIEKIQRVSVQLKADRGPGQCPRKGKRLGRRPLAEHIYEKAKELRRQNLSFRKISRELGIDEATIRKRMNHNR